jgi:hypothetical protein
MGALQLDMRCTYLISKITKNIMASINFGKKSYRKYHYHPHYDELNQNDGIIVGSILLVIWGFYWLLIHWVDHLLGNLMVWWVEPLTLFVTLPILGFFAMIIDKYESWNPLHWWPMFWGTKIMIDRESDWHIAFDHEEFVQNNGGRYNVFCGWDSNEDLYIKFRNKKDAVIYSLKNL